MTRDQFRALVEEAIDTIPRRFARQVRTSPSSSRTSPRTNCSTRWRWSRTTRCSGLYQGTPLPERHWGHGNTLPDRITLFQRTIEDDVRRRRGRHRVAIGETLIHELGHYFGMSEEEIMEIEERYWRGEPIRREPAVDESA